MKKAMLSMLAVGGILGMALGWEPCVEWMGERKYRRAAERFIRSEMIDVRKVETGALGLSERGEHVVWATVEGRGASGKLERAEVTVHFNVGLNGKENPYWIETERVITRRVAAE